MKYPLFFLFYILLSQLIQAQINTSQRFPEQNEYLNNDESSILQTTNGDLLMFWYVRYDDKIFYSRSTNQGTTWQETKIAAVNVEYDDYYKVDLNTFMFDNGRILLSYKGYIIVSTVYTQVYLLKYSDDNGITWSDPILLPTLDFQKCFASSFGLTADKRVAFIFSTQPNQSVEPKGIKAIFSSNGINWSSVKIIDRNGINGNLVSLNNSQDMVVFEDTIGEIKQIFRRISTDNGVTWLDRGVLISGNSNLVRSRAVNDSINGIFIFFEKEEETTFPGIYQPEIYFIKSTDAGENWSPVQKFTNYSGIDKNYNVSLFNNQPILTFSSSRNYRINNQTQQIYYGTQPDISTPPYLLTYEQTPDTVNANQPINVKAYVDDDQSINTVKLVVKINLMEPDTLEMYDDGIHNDSLANDKIFGVDIGGFKKGDGISYYFLLSDNENNSAGFDGGKIGLPFDFNYTSYRFEVNRFKVPFLNNGVIANVYSNEPSDGWYDESTVLFSGGFYLTGKNGNEIWATGQATAARIGDFLPGLVGFWVDDPKNQLYIIKASDLHFGESWQNYIYAVQLGAKFYDGNNDGIYNPIDINGNRIWDLHEDRPDFLGDVTAWCAYNDGVPTSKRAFRDQYPLGVEIKQTVFAIGNNITGPVENMFFIRYIISNKGTINNELDSVYFSLWSDPDISNQGYYQNLDGCDTLLNSGFCYSAGEDPKYGVNPPSLFLTLLQGPAVYISGETFIDNNSNEIFENSLDTPIDTAVVNNGLFVGSKILPGAKNLKMTSFMQNQRYYSGLEDPDAAVEVWNYLRGYNSYGEIINPCSLEIGNVVGVSCSDVNPFYLYSGDPESNFGWLDTLALDQRILVNTGPFKLKQNEPVEIWGAYIVGRGSNNLNSVTIAKEYVEYAFKYYKSNFTNLPVNVKNENLIVSNFILYQNYPNPFNPLTTIKYQIPETGRVTLKVFDILGQKVVTLTDKEQLAGNYEVEFDAKGLASGIYFYKLQTELYSSTKKMLLLK